MAYMPEKDPLAIRAAYRYLLCDLLEQHEADRLPPRGPCAEPEDWAYRKTHELLYTALQQALRDHGAIRYTPGLK